MVPMYSGYSVYAELKVGSNGTDEGVAETAAGDAGGTSAAGHTIWDEDVSDGVDSDWVRVSLVAGPSGVTWTVGNQAPVHVADSVTGEILSLKVRAAVSGGDRQSSWRDLVATFFTSEDGSGPTEKVTMSRAGNPVASTIGAASDAEADKTSDVWPDGSGYHMVQLTGSVRMQALQAGLPSPESVFGQVYLYAAPPVQPPPPPQEQVYVALTDPEATTTDSDTSVVAISNFTDVLSTEDLTLLA
jgi:hypothetical protein